MSRIGKQPILIPESVEVKIEGQKIIIKGPKGELQREIRPEIKVEVRGSKILTIPKIETSKTKAFWGLSRALINNMIKGVNNGYEKKLKIEGIGYRAALEGDNLVLQLGYTHPVNMSPPEGVKFSLDKDIITISGFDIEKVSQTAAEIRKKKPAEPYKGKGIRYLGEIIRRKAGKKATTTK